MIIIIIITTIINIIIVLIIIIIVLKFLDPPKNTLDELILNLQTKNKITNDNNVLNSIAFLQTY